MKNLNLTVFNELREFMEPEEFREFVQSVCNKLQLQIPLLCQLLTDANWEESQRVAHRLKGTVGSVGCDSLYALLHQFDAGLRQMPQTLPQTESIKRLETESAVTLDALKQQFALPKSAD